MEPTTSTAVQIFLDMFFRPSWKRPPFKYKSDSSSSCSSDVLDSCSLSASSVEGTSSLPPRSLSRLPMTSFQKFMVEEFVTTRVICRLKVGRK